MEKKTRKAEDLKDIVLVPTDFTDTTINAVDYGAQVASHLNYSLRILHVINRETKASLRKEGKGEEAVTDKLNSLAKEYSTKYQIEVNVIAEEGSIFTTIGEVADKIGANLMVLGTHGKVGLRQQMFGSFAHEVVTHSPVPVIVIQKDVPFDDGYNDIVFPVESDAEVRQKVNWCVHIARTFKSKIHLFIKNAQIHEDQVKLDVIVEQIKEKLAKNGIEYIDKRAGSGNFHDQVLHYSDAIKSDMIMIMTNPGSLNFILSVTDEQMIFNEYKIPVMCVNPIEYGFTRIIW